MKEFVGERNPEHYLLNAKEPMAVGPYAVQRHTAGRSGRKRPCPRRAGSKSRAHGAVLAQAFPIAEHKDVMLPVISSPFAMYEATYWGISVDGVIGNAGITSGSFAQVNGVLPRPFGIKKNVGSVFCVRRLVRIRPYR